MSGIEVFIGTNNPGKRADADRVAQDFEGIRVVGPADFDIVADPEETGDTYTANAQLKRDFFIAELRDREVSGTYVIGDDSGIEIDALGGEPGIHSRRWKDGKTAMSDEEIIEYALMRMKDVAEADRTAHFAGIIALGHTDQNAAMDLPYRLTGTLLTEPRYGSESLNGYPFRALFYMPEYDMMLSELSDLPIEQRPDGFMSHRELGLKRAFEMICELEADD